MKLLNTLAVVFCLYPILAHAESPVIESPVIVTNYSYFCGNVDQFVTKSTPNPDGTKSQSLVLQFDDFSVSQEGPGSNTKDCRIKASIKVPAGKRFSAVSATAHGVHDISGGNSVGRFDMMYRLQGIQRVGIVSKNLYGYNQFSATAKVPAPIFTDCSSVDQTFVLESLITLTANSTNYNRQSVALDETGENLKTSWKWQWKGCGDNPFQKRPFTSYYSAINGYNYKATLTIGHTSGHYLLENGQQGTLSNIQFSNNGKIASGYWRLNGKQGQFQFNLSDPTDGSFEGTWWTSQEHGTWRGYYK
jgi:hypothetical protein